MRYNLILSTAAATALLAACNSAPADGPADTATATTEAVSADTMADTGMAGTNSADSGAMAMGNQQFADGAAAGGMYEIESSKLALTKAQAAGVKTFAQKMITDHTKAGNDLKAAAAKAMPAVTPAMALMPDQQANITKLQGLSGAAFDTEYLAQQKAAHAATLAMLNSFAGSSGDAALKGFASATAPVVQMHIDMLDKM